MRRPIQRIYIQKAPLRGSDRTVVLVGRRYQQVTVYRVRPATMSRLLIILQGYMATHRVKLVELKWGYCHEIRYPRGTL